MSVALATRDWMSWIVAAGFAFLCAVLLGVLLLVGSVKLIALVLGTTLCLLAAYLSGNPRLFFLWALMLTIPLNLSKYFSSIVNKGSGEMALRIEISDVFLLALGAFLAWEIWTGRRAGLRIPKVTFLWILIMVMGCVTAVVGPWRWYAGLEVIRMAKVMLLFLVICNELERPRRFLHCAAGLTFAVLVQAIIGLLQYFRHASLGLEMLGEASPQTIEILSLTSVRTEKVFRISALLTHPNLFGIFLAALLPLAIGFFLLRIGKGYRLLFLSSASLGMAALIATLSRSSWVSFAAAFALLMVLAILHQGLRRRSLLAAAAATLTLATICVIFYGPITRRLFESKEQAGTARAEFEADAKRMIAEKPIFGFGLNSYTDALPPFLMHSRKAYGYWLPPVHHIYYLWWAETGIIGLAFQLAILGGIIWIGIGNLRVKDEVLFAVNAACLGGILALMVDGFFSFSLRVGPILRVFWVLAGMIMAVHYWRLRHPVPGAGLVRSVTAGRMTGIEPRTEAGPVA